MRLIAAVVVGVLVAGAAGGLGAGCGDDDEGAGGGSAATLAINMDDFKFVPDDAQARAGKVTITSENVGKVEHELELFKSDADPATLPVAEGRVDTEAFEKAGAEEVGELEAEAGKSAEKTFDLEPGAYVMICNLPSHYEQGMHGKLTVE